MVVVHEWTDPGLVRRIGQIRRLARFTLHFHDTHRRAVSPETVISGLAPDEYDGVLAFGEALRERYPARGWGRRVYTWHEAADIRLFRPMPEVPRDGDLIWVGSWGDGERAAELDAFLVEPVRRAATYYRGILRALAARGFETIYFEPDAHGRQQNRDIQPPDWARVVVCPATAEAVRDVTAAASGADIVSHAARNRVRSAAMAS